MVQSDIWHLIMAETKKIVDAYKTLSQEWSKKPPNLEKCGTILDSLKVKRLQVYPGNFQYS